MKFTTLFFAVTLTLSSLLVPVKKAEASLLIVNPIFFVVGMSLSTAGIVPFITSYDRIRGSAYDNHFNLVWFSLFSISVLDQDLDQLEGALINKFPSIPSYVLSEAAVMMKDKANLVEFNEQGLKSVTMTEEEFSDLESAMAGDANPAEVAALKKMLTVSEANN